MSPFSQYQLRNIVQDILNQLGLLVRLERKTFGIIASYAVAMGLFMLCVPIAVQELVSTFSFAVEPRMIFTLALMVAGALTGVAAFRILQARAVETLLQRIYTRIAIAFTQTLPRLQEESFLPQHANRLSEADLLTRALVAMVADLFNVAVVGSIFMSMLVLFHPYFLLYNVLLIGGFVVLLTVFGREGIPDHAGGVSLELRNLPLDPKYRRQSPASPRGQPGLDRRLLQPHVGFPPYIARGHDRGQHDPGTTVDLARRHPVGAAGRGIG